MYKLFLSWRYLSSRLLSLVAILVLALAIAIVVVAPAIMSGFQVEFHKRLRGTLSDLSIWAATPFGMPDDPEIAAYLRSLPNVEAVAPYLDNPALDKHLDKIDYCYLRGIDPIHEDKVSKFREYFLSEREVFEEAERIKELPPEEREVLQAAADALPKEPDVERVFERILKGDPDEPDLPTIAVGIYYLRYWDLRLGDTIKLTTASQEGEVAQDKKFKIVGVFRTGHHDTDRRILLMSLANMQKFVDVPGRVTGYSVKLVDYQQAQLTKDALAEDIRRGRTPMPTKEGFYVKTWEERNKNLLQAVAMEKLLIRLITGAIVVAAAASIFLVLFMSVHTKVRELGILRALGATRFGVLLLFLGQGFLIATFAMLLGFGLGWVFGHYINEIADFIHYLTGWHPFPPDVYYLERIPVEFVAGEVAWNFVFTATLGGVAAFVPGLLAALKPPLKAIRYD